MSYPYQQVEQNHHLSEPDVRTISGYAPGWSGHHYNTTGDIVHFNADNTYDTLDMYRAMESCGNDVYHCFRPSQKPLCCPLDCADRSPGYVPNPILPRVPVNPCNCESGGAPVVVATNVQQ